MEDFLYCGALLIAVLVDELFLLTRLRSRIVLSSYRGCFIGLEGIS